VSGGVAGAEIDRTAEDEYIRAIGLADSEDVRAAQGSERVGAAGDRMFRANARNQSRAVD